MKKIDWESYLKLFFGMLLIFPLEWAFWSLDFGKITGLGIATLIHTPLLILGVMMLNYLENGNCFQALNKIEGTLKNKSYDITNFIQTFKQ
jgi:hypothetical protein